MFYVTFRLQENFSIKIFENIIKTMDYFALPFSQIFANYITKWQGLIFFTNFPIWAQRVIN